MRLASPLLTLIVGATIGVNIGILVVGQGGEANWASLVFCLFMGGWNVFMNWKLAA